MKILVRDESGVRALEEGYASEAELQEFLREYAELIPMDDIDIGTPPLLCIGWEVGVSSGSQDLLYIDPTGRLTVVETKLKKNPEAKREVVGQILEYGAQMCTWTAADVERNANRFLASDICPPEYRGYTVEQALTLFLEKYSPSAAADFSYDGFLEAVTENLEHGRLRLVIAIDEPPESLLRTVEFVNRFSDHFEMYLLQLKRFRDTAAGQDVFVPAIFGRVARPTSGRAGPGTEWNADTFLAQASERASADSLNVLQHLIRFAEAQDAIVWGKGRNVASFRHQVVGAEQQRVDLLYVYATGKVELMFSSLVGSTPVAVIESYRTRLRQVGAIPEEVISTATWKSFDAGILAPSEALAAFEEAISQLTAELRGADQDG